MRSTVIVQSQVLNENVNLTDKSKLVSQTNSRNPFQDISNQQLRPNPQKTVAQKPTISVPSQTVAIVQRQELVSSGSFIAQPTNNVESIEIEGDETNKQNRRRKASDGDMGKPLRHSLRQSKRRKSEEMMEELEIENSPKKITWEDIDVNDFGDPSMVSVYVNDIYEYLSRVEQSTRVNPKYMSIQTEVTEKMRAILVDWMVEVHRMFKLLPETLFLTAAITDRYLAAIPVTKEKLQLIGVTSMLIASKYEEIYAPEVSDFVYITDGAYDREQILDMEEEILGTLNFSLNFISPLHFLRRFSKAAQSDYTIHTLCKYIIEISLIDIRLLKYLPSEIAVGATYLARAMTHQIPIWNSTLEHYSTYTEIQARDVAIEINKLLKKMQKSSLKSIVTKYSSPKCGQVATFSLINDL